MTENRTLFRIQTDRQVWVLLALAALAAAPLTAPGYFSQAHDARHTVYFLQMFDAALRDGALYPRWATDMTFGYGYPVWIILAPLPYYLGEAFHLLGLDFVSAVKAVDALALFASGLAMYLFASRVLGKNEGLLAAVAYLFVPYHLVDLYVRAAAAEFLAFAFPPLVLWALYELIIGRRTLFAPVAALAYAGLVLTHVQMAVLFSPVIGLYILLLWAFSWRGAASQGPGSLARLIVIPTASILLGVLLSATFLLPVLFEQRYLTNEPLIGGFFDFRQHFISPAQLLSPFWGYGYAGINGGDQFSLQLGVAPLFLAALALVTLRRGIRSLLAAQVIFFACVTLGVILLMLPLSAPFWEAAAPIIAFLQFPWRLLTITALALAFLSGAALRAFAREDRFPAALVLALLAAVAMFPFARPQYTEARFNNSVLMDFEVKDHELLGDTIWMTGERPQDSPLVEQYRAGAITQKAVIVEGEGKVELLAHRSQGDEVLVTAVTPVRLQFYTRYFPGWTVTVDNALVPVEPYGDQGLLAVQVPAGTHTVTSRFGDTWPRQAGAAISLVALATALAWLVLARKRERARTPGRGAPSTLRQSA